MNTEETTSDSIQFYAGYHTTVFSISRDGIWANPDVPVDDTAKQVLEIMGFYIKKMVQKAVEEEREACAQLCQEEYDAGLLMAPVHLRLAASIRARGEK